MQRGTRDPAGMTSCGLVALSLLVHGRGPAAAVLFPVHFFFFFCLFVIRAASSRQQGQLFCYSLPLDAKHCGFQQKGFPLEEYESSALF